MMKEKSLPNTSKNSKESLLHRVESYLKSYAKKCRDSYYGMLSL